MSRPGKLFLILLLMAGAAAAVAVAAVAWLVGTPSGARTLLDLASRFTPFSIEAERVEGSLARDLQLEGVRLTMPQKKISARRLRLQWHPLELLSNNVAVDELSLAGVEVIDYSPPSKEPPHIAWPTVPRSLGGWEASIGLLQVDGLTYRRPHQPPLTVKRFAAAATWRNGVLALNRLTIDSPAGRLRGRLAAGLIRPSLSAHLKATLPRPAGGMDSFSLTSRLLPGSEPGEIVTGSVSITGADKGKPQVAVTANVGIEPTRLTIKELQATRPGRPGTVAATGTVRLTSDQPVFDLRLSLTGVDLKKETGTSTNLSGRISIAGTTKKYSGDFNIANRGTRWREGRIAAAFTGTGTGIELSRINGNVAGGTIVGTASADWQKGIKVDAALQGKRLDPATIDPRWRGSLNADMAGSFIRSASGTIAGHLTGAFRDSVLQGWPLDGEIDAEVSGKNVRLRQLALRGEGFRITAMGELSRRIDFSAAITDLARILPDYAGAATAEGWVHWRGKGMPSGSATVAGTCLRIPGARLAAGHLTMSIEGGSDLSTTSFDIRALLDGIRYRGFRADSATIDLSGTLSAHTVMASVASPEAAARVTVRGGYADDEWRGTLLELAGHDKGGGWQAAAPAAVSVSRKKVILSDLIVEGMGAERVTLSADARLNPLRGTILAGWSDLALNRVNPWLEGAVLDGRTSGSVVMATTAGDRFTLAGNVAASGTLSLHERRVTVHSLALDLNWRENGLAGTMLLDLGDFGRIDATATSPSPPVFAMPTAGEADLRWDGVDLAMLKPWLPASMDLTGRLGGRITARLLAGGKFDMIGKAMVENGVWTVENAGNDITTSIRALEASWSWQNDGLRGSMLMELGQWGKARAEVAVPLPATIPLAPTKDIPLQAHATGRVQELGLLTAFFPGFVQDATGELAFDLTAGGTASKPAVDGSFDLARAGGYVPAAGIRIADSRLHASFSRDRVTIDTLRVSSGSGYLDGQAVIELKEGRLATYRGTIGGKDFEALNLPELHGLVSPRLELEGTPDMLAVRGEVLVPELQVRGETPQAPVQPSEDVIIVDAPREEKGGRLTVRLDIGITLGERVTVKMKGIDAQLKGSVRLSGTPADLTSRGEIHVVKGRYKAYGIDLDIARGRIFYAGVSLERPAIDIVALRSANEVKAGVTVGGTLQRPVVQLYSEPPMPDVDILAYIILGHPLGQSGEQAGLLAKAAGALLSAGQSVALQDQLKSRLGLSTLEIQTVQEDRGYMGYKPIAVGPAGTGTTGGGEIAETTVMLGKYLTRKLYVSYGRSIFTGANIFRLRYDFSRQFQLETQTGAESGVDLYYKVRFD